MSEEENDDSAEYQYILRVPIASSIYHKLSREETYSILKEINVSRSASQALPEELIQRINHDIHTSTYELVRSAWTPITDPAEVEVLSWDSMLAYTAYTSNELYGEILPLARARLDRHTRKYSFGDTLNKIYEKFQQGDTAGSSNDYHAHMIRFSNHISAGDLLYRLRCFFPEIHVASYGPEGEKVVWSAGLRHKETGLGLGLTEWNGRAALRIDWSKIKNRMWRLLIHQSNGTKLRDKMKKLGIPFSIDAIQLLNAFFETIDGTRLSYFHPAADADVPMENERYPDIKGEGSYEAWDVSSTARADLTSFKSILSKIKYNPESRQVDMVNGTVELSSVISSSSFFYRILCLYRLRFPSNVDTVTPITSVWQVKFIHHETGAPVIFMDDRGLIDVRAGVGAEQVMKDIVALITFIAGAGHPSATLHLMV